MWQEYMEQRKKVRAKEEDELKKLKERQVNTCFIHSFIHSANRFLIVIKG